MKLLSKIKALEFKFIIWIFGLIGATGAYNLVTGQYGHNSDPWGLFRFKMMLTITGMTIGIVVGILTGMLIDAWDEMRMKKIRTMTIYGLLGLAPILLAFLDFEEHIKSTRGFWLFAGINLIGVTWLITEHKLKREKLIPILLLVPIWELIIFNWFISVTWQHMNYWD